MSAASTARILVIDEGTTGVRAIIFDEHMSVLEHDYAELRHYHPEPGWVEQDPEDIWQSTSRVVEQALERAGVAPGDLTAVGITNQRATTVVWDRRTGRPVGRAIVWQDTRTAPRVAELAPQWGERVYSRTGWALAPVYSSLSLEWILGNVPEARELAENGNLAFGTVASWVIHRPTGGARHVISASNASVTGSYDLHENDWYREWLQSLGIPLSVFPEVVDDAGLLGMTDAAVLGAEVPIRSAIADQHSALFAQGCILPGDVKCTHGTGTFLDMNIGTRPVIDTSSGLTCQIAWRFDGETVYSLEGYAGTTGAAVQWLRDGAGVLRDAEESETLARSVPDNGGVFFVPALTGLSAPSWDATARGLIVGITPGTTRGHIARAALEGIVLSVRDFVDTMASVSGAQISSIAADGGASRNDLLLQIQADVLGVDVVRTANTAATAVGAAMLAGLAAGVWSSPEEALATQDIDRAFRPAADTNYRDSLLQRWDRAVERAKGWAG